MGALAAGARSGDGETDGFHAGQDHPETHKPRLLTHDGQPAGLYVYVDSPHSLNGHEALPDLTAGQIRI